MQAIIHILYSIICSPKLCATNKPPIILIDGDNMPDHCAIYVTLDTPLLGPVPVNLIGLLN